MKKFFNKMLKSIEDANKQNFGTKKMDCCDLNQTSNQNTKNRGNINKQQRKSN